MAYPASSGVVAYKIQELDKLAVAIKGRTSLLRDSTAAGEVARVRFNDLLVLLSDFIDFANEVAAITGIGAAIDSQKPDFAGDVVAEAQAMVSAAVTLRNWIHQQLQSVDFYTPPDINGERSHLTFTTAQTVTFRTNADAFIATIE